MESPDPSLPTQDAEKTAPNVSDAQAAREHFLEALGIVGHAEEPISPPFQQRMMLLDDEDEIANEHELLVLASDEATLELPGASHAPWTAERITAHAGDTSPQPMGSPAVNPTSTSEADLDRSPLPTANASDITCPTDTSPLIVACPKCAGELAINHEHIGIQGACVWCSLPIVATRSGASGQVRIIPIFFPPAAQPISNSETDAIEARGESVDATESMATGQDASCEEPVRLEEALPVDLPLEASSAVLANESLDCSPPLATADVQPHDALVETAPIDSSSLDPSLSSYPGSFLDISLPEAELSSTITDHFSSPATPQATCSPLSEALTEPVTETAPPLENDSEADLSMVSQPWGALANAALTSLSEEENQGMELVAVDEPADPSLIPDAPVAGEDEVPSLEEEHPEPASVPSQLSDMDLVDEVSQPGNIASFSDIISEFPDKLDSVAVSPGSPTLAENKDLCPEDEIVSGLEVVTPEIMGVDAPPHETSASAPPAPPVEHEPDLVPSGFFSHAPSGLSASDPLTDGTTTSSKGFGEFLSSITPNHHESAAASPHPTSHLSSTHHENAEAIDAVEIASDKSETQDTTTIYHTPTPWGAPNAAASSTTDTPGNGLYPDDKPLFVNLPTAELAEKNPPAEAATTPPERSEFESSLIDSGEPASALSSAPEPFDSPPSQATEAPSTSPNDTAAPLDTPSPWGLPAQEDAPTSTLLGSPEAPVEPSSATEGFNASSTSSLDTPTDLNSPPNLPPSAPPVASSPSVTPVVLAPLSLPSVQDSSSIRSKGMTILMVILVGLVCGAAAASFLLPVENYVAKARAYMAEKFNPADLIKIETPPPAADQSPPTPTAITGQSWQ